MAARVEMGMSTTASETIGHFHRTNTAQERGGSPLEPFKCDAPEPCSEAVQMRSLMEMMCTGKSPECCEWPMRMLGTDEVAK